MGAQEQGQGRQANQNYMELEGKGKEQKVATHDQSKIAHLADIYLKKPLITKKQSYGGG